MNKKSSAGTGTYSIIFGVAFVWFTTHFGGGFASGAQIYSYYVRFGIWCLIMPALAMLYNGIFFAYGMRFARKHEVYDYRSYNNAFYGKFAPVFSNLFEVLYICVMCVAPAVAFATGGATLSTLTGLPYLLCTLIIGIFIFIVAIFGTDLVRRVASVLSICIIAGLLIVYIPNIIHGWSAIRAAAQQMTTSTQPFGKSTLLRIPLRNVPAGKHCGICPARQSIQKTGDAVKSMGLGFIINALMMTMVCLGIMTVSTSPDMAGTSVPTLLMVQNGIGKGFMTPLISILIILGAVSTAVNMVAAMVKRVSDGLKKRTSSGKNDVSDGTPKAETPDINTRKRISSREIIIALICCLIDFGIAQFGLLTLIQKAYSFLAYLAIPVILVPYIIHMIVTRMDSK